MRLIPFLDRHLYGVTNHPLVLRARWKARYLRWRIFGTGPYSEEYVNQVAASIESGNRHGTLSVVLDDPEQARREADFVAETVDAQGLGSTDFCIEYGCGSLRIGEPIMRRLEPGHYIGLDVTDRFWENGIRRLGDAFVETYRPRLQRIDDQVGELARLDARVVVCVAVLIHIPPPEVEDFLARLASVVGMGSTLILDGRLGSQTRQVHGRTWHHARTRILQALARQGLHPLTPEPLTRAGLPLELWMLRRASSA